MAVQINKVTNASLYIDGGSMIGKAMEISLPTVKHVMAEHEALGMLGKTKHFAGIEALEGSVKWNSFYADVLRNIGDPTKALKLQVRAPLQSFSTTGLDSEVAVVVYLTATFTELPGGDFKQHQNVELESAFTATYMKVEIDGVVEVEIDLSANIYNVGGNDILENYRSIIGS